MPSNTYYTIDYQPDDGICYPIKGMWETFFDAYGEIAFNLAMSSETADDLEGWEIERVYTGDGSDDNIMKIWRFSRQHGEVFFIKERVRLRLVS